MDNISQFFQNAFEVRNFGFNVNTISAGITVLLSTYQMWGLTQQIATIRRRKSAESLFMPLFVFGFFYLVSTFIYGIYTDKISIVYNGLNSLFFSVLLLMAWRYRKFDTADFVSLCLFSLMIPLIVLSPDKKSAYMGCASVMLLGGIAQLILLIMNKKRGSLEPKLFNVYIVTNSSWLIYGIITKDWVFQVSNSISVSIMIAIAVLLRKYKDR